VIGYFIVLKVFLIVIAVKSKVMRKLPKIYIGDVI